MRCTHWRSWLPTRPREASWTWLTLTMKGYVITLLALIMVCMDKCMDREIDSDFTRSPVNPGGPRMPTLPRIPWWEKNRGGLYLRLQNYKWTIKLCVNKHAKSTNSSYMTVIRYICYVCWGFFLIIYFAKVSLTYMPTGPCGPSMPGFPVKPWRNTKIYESKRCGYYMYVCLCDCVLTLSPGDPGGPVGPDFPVGPCQIHN